MKARLIDKEQAGTVDAWSFPPVDDVGAGGAAARFVTPRELAELERQVREEAERRGYADGLAAGRAEVAAAVRHLTGIADALVRPLENVDQEVERQLIGLAIALASHIVRREIERDATPSVEAVRDCMAALPAATREAVLYLNPADASLVAEHLDQNAPKHWKIVPDETLARGDVKLASESSRIDGRLETRLREIVAVALSHPDPGGDDD